MCRISVYLWKKQKHPRLIIDWVFPFLWKKQILPEQIKKIIGQVKNELLWSYFKLYCILKQEASNVSINIKILATNVLGSTERLMFCFGFKPKRNINFSVSPNVFHILIFIHYELMSKYVYVIQNQLLLLKNRNLVEYNANFDSWLLSSGQIFVYVVSNFSGRYLWYLWTPYKLF